MIDESVLDRFHPAVVDGLVPTVFHLRSAASPCGLCVFGPFLNYNGRLTPIILIGILLNGLV